MAQPVRRITVRRDWNRIPMRLDHRDDAIANLKGRNGKGKQAEDRDCGKSPSSPAPNEKKDT